jgi:diadenosine tetraphosphate (Ap4A) HIT family hydrolase
MAAGAHAGGQGRGAPGADAPAGAASGAEAAGAVQAAGCVLCDTMGGLPVFESAALRVVRAEEPGFPAFYRVVWQAHAAEFSDLPPADRILCMDAVAVVERCLREALAPDKINLAALGNMVPHLHWHVIARFGWDSHFPAAAWAAPQRERDAAREAEIAARLPALDARLARRLADWMGAPDAAGRRRTPPEPTAERRRTGTASDGRAPRHVPQSAA